MRARKVEVLWRSFSEIAGDLVAIDFQHITGLIKD